MHQFVAKDGDATGLEPYDGDTGFDFGREFVEDFKQERLSAVEHAVVVERAAAAEIRFWDDDTESGGFEDFDGGFGGAGQEIIVESVGPEENGRGIPVSRGIVWRRGALAAVETRPEAPPSESWDRALLGSSGGEFCEVAQEWAWGGQISN